MWCGRFHPIMSLLSPALGKQYLENRLHGGVTTSDMKSEITAVLHDLIVRSHVLIRSRKGVGTFSWSSNSHKSECWDWAIIFKIVSVVMLTSLTLVHDSEALLLFVNALSE